MHAPASADSPLPLRVLSLNVWCGGEAGGQPLEQTAKVIAASGCDVAGLQEAGQNALALAEQLGWHCVTHEQGMALLSRFDIAHARTFTRGTHVQIRLPGGPLVHVFNTHLAPSPYQPYQLLRIPYGDAPFLDSAQQAVDAARAARWPGVEHLLDAVTRRGDTASPVVLTGDFNEPSHLDWTDAAARHGYHPIAVPYPVSTAMADAGLTDTWRALHRDEVASPGLTWSPLTAADDPVDHHDRIDFVYFGGAGIKPVEVRIVGEDAAMADIVVSPYPSDHRGVVATFAVDAPASAAAG